MQKIKIGLVDDHKIVLDGLLALLQNNDATTVLALVLEHKIDLLVTDIMMPELSGRQLAALIKDHCPEVKILALSISCDADMIQEMIQESSISGYALKNISKEDFLHGIEVIANGGVYFSKEVLEELQRTSSKDNKAHDVWLTDREIEIIKLIEQEKNNKQIASELYISERTVETHRKNIFRKTGTSSALGIVKYAYEHKLI
jgi:two-component system nitrate/nitrite response regulator NarL